MIEEMWMIRPHFLDFIGLASLVAGGVLALGGLVRGLPGGLISLALGGGLIYRGVTGNCCMYKALGINTAREQHHNPATAVPAQQLHTLRPVELVDLDRLADRRPGRFT